MSLPYNFFQAILCQEIGKQLDFSAGRASVVNGAIVYSPNCNRTVTLPPRPEQCTYLRNTDTVDVSDLHQPFWWSPGTAYLAFLPMNPKFTGVPFQELFDVHVKHTRSGYTMGIPTTLWWKKIEEDLQHFIDVFSKYYGVPKVQPIMVTALTCSGFFKYASNYRRQVKRTRGWYSVYMGTLSYIMAAALEIDRDGPHSLPKWFQVFSKNHNEVLLSGIRTSSSSFDTFSQRVGIFLDIMHVDPTQYSVDFLYKYDVPVWYCWGPSEARAAKTDPSLSRLAPLPDQLQLATTFLTKSIALKKAREDRMDDNSEFPWVAFFEKRDKSIAVLTRCETQSAQQARVERNRNPPTVNTKVFVWEKDEDGGYSRQLVGHSENSTTLQGFGVSQKIYDSYYNEWDCGEDFGDLTAEELQQQQWDGDDDDDDDDDGYNFLYDAPDRPEARSSPPIVKAPSTKLSAVTTNIANEVVGRWIPIFHAITHSHTYEVENYPATQTLHEFFGFVPPLPVPTKHPSPINLAADQLHRFATTVGMKSLDSEFEKSTVMQYCWEFVHSFRSGSMPPSELYDLAVGNRICILGTTRFQFLRWMKGGNLFSLVLPLSLASVPWHLTVTNAIERSLLCPAGSDRNRL